MIDLVFGWIYFIVKWMAIIFGAGIVFSILFVFALICGQAGIGPYRRQKDPTETVSSDEIGPRAAGFRHWRLTFAFGVVDRLVAVFMKR